MNGPSQIGGATIRNGAALKSVRIAIGQALLIAASLYVFLQGWVRDFRVPLGFSSDSLFYLMQSKSTIDNGWWWFNPMLGAPFGLDELAFPSNSNVDQAIVWLVSRFVGHPARSVNLAWMAMVVLSGVSATWCMRRLGISTVSSIVAGTLFALSPYALYRNIDHLAMVIYLVPFASTAALLLASGIVPERGAAKAVYGGLLAGCALLGFNYVYYAFFACFFIGLAALVGFAATRERRVLMAGAVLLAVTASCTLVNLAPSLYSWREHGSPIILRDKVPAESEVYGLKIRQLVSPIFEHPFAPFRWWTEKEAAAQFPSETENMMSRLGLVGSIGFLGLLCALFVPQSASRSSTGTTLLHAGQLALAGVLLGTVGGFGSLFNLLVSPQIRAYNRITPFIAFFSLVAVAVVIDSLARTRGRRMAAAAIVVTLGLADQHIAATGLNNAYPAIAAELPPLTAFVRQVESRLPARAMVLQLPFRTFLNDEGIARLKPYEHLKLYMVSQTIHWSYPALSNEQVRWQQTVAGVNPQQLPHQLAADGFAAVVIDRYGYEDNGAAVIAAVRTSLVGNPIIAETERYIALDVRSRVPSDATPVVTSTQPVPLTAKLAACDGPPLLNIEQIGGERSPFADRQIRLAGSRAFKVSGWAVDPQRESSAAGADVVVDRTPFPSLFGTDRSDVAAYFKRPAYGASGFAAELQANTLSKGPHTLSLRVVSSGGDCYYESPGIPIVID